MSLSTDNTAIAPYLAGSLQEIEGTPKPGAQETADEAIRKIMNPVKREASRNSLPDLAPE